jgi:hypothetical protein
VALIVVLGVYPKPVLDRITPSVTRLVHHVEVSTGTHQPVVATGGTVRYSPLGDVGAAGAGRVP